MFMKRRIEIADACRRLQDIMEFLCLEGVDEDFLA